MLRGFIAALLSLAGSAAIAQTGMGIAMAWAILRRVGRGNIAFRPDLAMSLNNLATMLSNLGQREPALVEGHQEADRARPQGCSLPGRCRDRILHDRRESHRAGRRVAAKRRRATERPRRSGGRMPNGGSFAATP